MCSPICPEYTMQIEPLLWSMCSSMIERLNTDDRINSTKKSSCSSYKKLNLFFYTSMICLKIVSFMMPGISSMNPTSFSKSCELTLSPNNDRYLTLSPVKPYLLDILWIISILWLFLYISIDCTKVASKILELISVNNITPTIIHAILNNLSWVLVAGMSP